MLHVVLTSMRHILLVAILNCVLEFGTGVVVLYLGKSQSKVFGVFQSFIRCVDFNNIRAFVCRCCARVTTVISIMESWKV